MKQLFLILLASISVFPLFSQDCKCSLELDFVINYYEVNLPGFKDNVNEKNINNYQNFKKDLKKQSEALCNNRGECFKLLTMYVEFFKDNHSSISDFSVGNVNEKDALKLNEFVNSDVYTTSEIIDVSTLKIPSNKISKLENVYQSKDGTYKVAVIKSVTPTRDYIGVILESKTILWKNGQVKFELKKTGKNSYDMFLYRRNHSLMYLKNVQLNNGVLARDWFNVKLKEIKDYSTEVITGMEFREIDATTNYIYIPTFSAYETDKIHKFYNQYDSLIQAKPNLIIDVRNNGGGSDANASPLLNYIYTKPFYNDTVDLYVTEENIRKSIAWYEENKSDTVNFDEVYMNEVLEEINRMQKAPLNSFIPRMQGELIALNISLKYPSKVAVIMNRNCASSCEALLFWAKESDKTILVGENSGGYVGYGEITTVKTPHFNFDLGCTMTRYNKQRAYEVIGISPDYYLDNKSDWIDQALKLMQKK